MASRASSPSLTLRPVTITSRGKELVPIEPIRTTPRRAGYGSMRGTVEILVSEDELVSTGRILDNAEALGLDVVEM
jgi:hypothetical protein